MGYLYDPAGRLITANDTLGPTCTTRTYTFDLNSDRTGSTSTPSPSGSTTCPMSTDATSTVHTTTFDRATTTSATSPGTGTTNGTYVYDPFARVVSQPGTDVAGSGSGTIALGYYVNDLTHTQTQDTHTRTLRFPRFSGVFDVALSLFRTPIRH